MKIRSSLISTSILEAISNEDDPTQKRGIPGKVLDAVVAFFSFFNLGLARYRAADFLTLRHDAWQLDEREYLDSFPKSTGEGASKGKAKDAELQSIGDLGYSGSTFFTTTNSKYLIKSLPRRFEHQFFTHDLLDGYVAHMKKNPHSLLVRITDMVYTPHATLGGILGTAPTHHIIMENLLYGKESEQDEERRKKWETYDLKPNDYFFPERDIADGALVPDSVMDKLIDEFPDRVRIRPEKKKELLEVLEADTKLLADSNAVDYSLFLVRYPGPKALDSPQDVVTIKSNANEWRTGMTDAEGLWTYRAVVLDFFWAKHKFQAQAMTGLVKSFNLIANKGPMSITTDPDEYRERFLKMVDTIVVEVTT